ncbi:sensor histidine kinase [Chloroflexus aggregans]|uniref:sensor histidine kinase n=1 Tax=Chloroflexus aggregans TaxID=152260 RepID=UPI000674AAC0|nr:HAMP domain-containing sensor histidine kinase [Chloroflexus aggregans]
MKRFWLLIWRLWRLSSLRQGWLLFLAIVALGTAIAVFVWAGWWWPAILAAFGGGWLVATSRVMPSSHMRSRLAELERELAVAQQEAAVAAKAKSAFLAHVSHELHSPLMTILGYSELLLEDVQNGTAQTDQTITWLQRIYDSGKQLLELIDNMIVLARLEVGDIEVYHDRWSLGLLLDELEKTILPLAQQRHNRFAIDLEVDPAIIIEGDRAKIRQILLQLLHNATKFTQDGTITLRVSLKSSTEGSALLNLTVSDSGIGMSDDQLDLLFEPFTRFDEVLTPRYDGVGIGLALAQRLCLAIGGSIAVTSQPGKGTTFFVSIPVTPVSVSTSVER